MGTHAAGSAAHERGHGAKLAEEVLAGVRATAGAQTEPEPDSDGRGPTNEDRGSGPA